MLSIKLCLCLYTRRYKRSNWHNTIENMNKVQKYFYGTFTIIQLNFKNYLNPKVFGVSCELRTCPALIPTETRLYWVQNRGRLAASHLKAKGRHGEIY